MPPLLSHDELLGHYTDFSPEKLKEIYDKVNIKVLK
jgi:hypothetical protein